jgi:hypothetical protein
VTQRPALPVEGRREELQACRAPRDNHDLWIAPEDPQRMVEGNDGGANVTFDGGRELVERSTTSRRRSSTT